MPETRASKITEPPTMADNSPGLPGGGADGDGLGAVPAPADPTVPEVTAPAVIDLTDNDAAMIKLFERLGALKGAASFFVLDQGMDSLSAIHDLDDDAIESLCKL